MMLSKENTMRFTARHDFFSLDAGALNSRHTPDKVVEIATPHRAASPSVPSLTKREVDPRVGRPFHGKAPRCSTSRTLHRAERRIRKKQSRS